MEKQVCVGSRVSVEVYLGTAAMDSSGKIRRKFLQYKRFLKDDNPEYLRAIVVTSDATFLEKNGGIYCHPESFIGRAMLGRKVGDEVEVNVGGLSVDELRVGQMSGNHLKLVVVKIE